MIICEGQNSGNRPAAGCPCHFDTGTPFIYNPVRSHRTDLSKPNSREVSLK